MFQKKKTRAMAGREAFEALLSALTTKNSTVVQASGWIKAQTERSELEFAGDALCKVRHPSEIVGGDSPPPIVGKVLCAIQWGYPSRTFPFPRRRPYAPTSVPSSRSPPFLSVTRVSHKYSSCVFRPKHSHSLTSPLPPHTTHTTHHPTLYPITSSRTTEVRRHGPITTRRCDLRDERRLHRHLEAERR